MKANERHQALITYRDDFEDMGEKLSALTKVPFRKSTNQYDRNRKIPMSYQSLGALGAQTLASKIALGMIPSNAPWFDLSLDEMTQDQLAQEAGVEIDNIRSAIRLDFDSIVRVVMEEVKAKSIRSALETALQQLISVACPLLFLDEDNRIVMFTLDRYGIRRDRHNNIAEITVEECFLFDTLEPDVTCDRDWET